MIINMLIGFTISMIAGFVFGAPAWAVFFIAMAVTFAVGVVRS